MKILDTPFKNAYVLEPEPFEDHRGKFSRIFCQKTLEKIGLHNRIAQINHSVTREKGALRGMHFQYPPRAETRVVICLRGSVFDVMIDLRHNSASFLKWHGEVLSAESMRMAYIPEGFAHGFQTLEKNCELIYLHTGVYSPEHEGGVRSDDPRINICWPLRVTDISKRDQSHSLLSADFKGI